MSREVCSFLFTKNNAKISVNYLTPKEIKKEKIDKDDCLSLIFNKDDDPLEIRIRPDEALIIANLLISAVNKTTHGYLMRYDKRAL